MRAVSRRKPPRAAEAQIELVATPCDAARLARTVMNEEQETFVVICRNVRNMLIGKPIVVAMGTAHEVRVHPRDVFREAVRCNAVGVVVLHNHPSGATEPSIDDIAITRRLIKCGELLNVVLLDHVIVTTTSANSLAANEPKLWLE